MEIKAFHPSEQVDPAVDLGAAPPPLPEIVSLRAFAADPPLPPPLIIEGVLHQGCKMILGGTSKSNKSWCLLDLALSVASGQKWWGRQCTRMPVVYINFELHGWAIAERINALCAARPECGEIGETFHLWNENQALQWPREDCLDPDGGEESVLDSDAVPTGVVWACCEMARELYLADRLAAPAGEGISEQRNQDGSAIIYSKKDTPQILTPLAQAMLAKYGRPISEPSADVMVKLVRA